MHLIMIKYHNPDSCNKCKGKNDVDITAFDEGHMSEAKTECLDCGFNDFWAYGFFESGEDMGTNCKTYSFKNGKRVDYE